MAKIARGTKKEHERVAAIFSILQQVYPNAHCTLDYKSPFQLLIMAILSAQCTDARVNRVCQSLFKKFKTPEAFRDVASGELEEAIKPCGFYHQKARWIREACRLICERHEGKVPSDMDSLLQLPGVGRKIANAILGECFHIPGVIVDTHCTRVTSRLGFTTHSDPVKIEKDLMVLWPREYWTIYSHCMVFHGRACCTARNPKCLSCPVLPLCPWGQKNKPGKSK